MAFTPEQRRTIRILVVAQLLSAALWSAIYVTAQASKKANVLWVGTCVFCLSFLAFLRMILVFRRVNREPNPEIDKPSIK